MFLHHFDHRCTITLSVDVNTSDLFRWCNTQFGKREWFCTTEYKAIDTYRLIFSFSNEKHKTWFLTRWA